ncbi:hypothetical protein BVX97_06580 [bacterium E08(2017)]|nr:hypothetical protein BVX97_06580 [bacterium E08(2017)]
MSISILVVMLLLTAEACFAEIPLWTPFYSTNTVQAWYDASDLDTITEVGGFVSQWDDKTTNGYNLLQSGDLRPMFLATNQNGNGVIRFDGTNDTMAAATITPIVQPWEVYFMLKNLSNSSKPRLLTGAGVTLYQFVNTGGGKPTLNAGSGFAFASALTPGEGHFLRFTANGASSIGNKDYVEYGPGDAGTNSISEIRVGGTAASSVIDLDMYECVIIQGIMSDDDRRRMEGYLAWKWGFEDKLPVDHDYKSAPPYYYAPATVVIVE